MTYFCQYFKEIEIGLYDSAHQTTKLKIIGYVHDYLYASLSNQFKNLVLDTVTPKKSP